MLVWKTVYFCMDISMIKTEINNNCDTEFDIIYFNGVFLLKYASCYLVELNLELFI